MITAHKNFFERNVEGGPFNVLKNGAPQGVRSCGAVFFVAGLWRQSRLTVDRSFLHSSNDRRNGFDVSPTVRSFPEPKKRDIPGANFARKGFPSARLLQGELRDSDGIRTPLSP